jgi:hypothetical protein
MTRPTITAPATLAGLAQALLAAGYRRGTPSALAAEVDAEVCQEAVCSACGHRGLDYYPFVTAGSYRAVAACPCCGAAEEF